MRLFLLSLAALVWSTALATAGGDGWATNLDEAFTRAKAEKKPVLVEFTGSDWCPPCIMMQKNVFSRKEFLEEASKKFILVEIDIPNKDPDLKKKNMPMLKKHEVKGVPTVLLFSPDAEEFDRFGAAEFPSVKEFLARLDKALERKDLL